MAAIQTRDPVLRSHQVEHFNKCLEILTRFYFYIDGSEPGTGKTHVACAIAKRLGLPMVVVCPSVAKVTWTEAFRMYGIAYWNIQNTGPIMTYETFRSTRKHQPKHGLLVRDDSGEAPMFFPTVALAHITRVGAFFVFDECQRLKNNNAAHKAVQATISYIYTGAGNTSVSSRAGFLSGTVLDKEVQAVNFMRMVGFITHRNLYTKIDGEVRLQGIAELQDWARRINPGEAEDYIRTRQFTAARVQATDYAFQLFRRVIRTHVLSIMPKVLQRDATGRPVASLNIKNGFYLMPEADAQSYQDAIDELAGAVRFDPTTGQVDQPRNSIGAVTTALTHLHRSKTNLAIRLVREALEETYTNAGGQVCQNKVILFADYYEVIVAVKTALAQYNPLELTGRIKDEQKPIVINAFNADNGMYRLLVANPVVGGMSINLQDMTGRWRRKMFLMPGYRINELHQASLRTYRDGTIGDVFVRFIYGLTRQGNIELSILNSLARKGKVMHQILEEQRVKFPGEYENEYEVDPRTRFGDSFFTRNRVLLPAESSDSEQELAEQIEELDLDSAPEPVNSTGASS